jgi:PEP-CTERM motif
MLVVLLTLICAQATLTANPTYSFGPTIDTSFATNAYTAGVWTEVFTGGAGTTEQIVCMVGLTVADETNTCGNPGPGSSAHISITTAGQPGNSAILPSGTTNYLEADGDPAWGAPVWTNVTGLIVGGQYQLSFYQASNEENGNDKAYSDSWKVYLIPGAATGSYICLVCATPVDPLPGDLAFTSQVMLNAGSVTTPWQLESFTFKATNTSEILEFVTNAVGTAPFAPPFFNLAGVSSTLTQTPEPTTWALTILGIGAAFAARKLRRRSSASE